MNDLDYKVFSGGEVHVKINDINRHAINAIIKNSNDFMALALKIDALRRMNPDARVFVKMPYVPYARQDRVCNEGEALSIAVFSKLLNALKIDAIEIFDPHSDVTPALINNVMVRDQKECFQMVCGKIKDYAIISPDAGARKKSYHVATLHNAPVVEAEKKRGADGRISKTVIYDELPDVKKYVVIDDICDYGGTFISLAKTLREKTNKPLYLYVTHGIFAAGYDELLQYYDKIYCCNNMRDGQTLITRGSK